MLGPKPKEPKLTLTTNLFSRAKTVKRKIHEVIGGDGPDKEVTTKKRKIMKAKSTKAATTPVNKAVSPGIAKTTSLREKVNTLTKPAGINRKSSKTVTYAKRRRSYETVKNSASASGYKRGGISKTQSIKTAGASLRKTVARSLRGSRAAALAANTALSQNGSTVRLVAEVAET